MDVAALFNTEQGQQVLDPWPEQEEQSQPSSDYAADAAAAAPDGANDTGIFDIEMTPPVQVPPPTQAPTDSLSVQFTTPSVLATPILPRDPPCSKWDGDEFNMPGGREKGLPKLMAPHQIDIERKIELHKLHTAVLEFTEGDTLVIIDYPTQKKTPGSFADCNGVTFKSQQFRVHSQKLLATGSSKFSEMLNPTYQFRVLRRRSLVDKLPEAVKYVLDLTPPFEGDELVFQMTELSLTPGIVKWWTSAVTYDVDAWLVSGHDDVCACLREMAGKDPSNTSPYKILEDGRQRRDITMSGRRFPNFPYSVLDLIEMKRMGDNDIFDIPNYRQLPDYCPIRHRNCLVRLLMLIEGKKVPLDSASRLWTMVGLSKIWDCTGVLRDRVTQWIMYGSNTRFIELLPEEALQLGYALEIPEVTQSAFKILVNELALKDAATNSTGPNPAHATVFGRKLGDLPDELSNLVQHAARAFVERVTTLTENLQNPSSLPLTTSPEWKKLLLLERILQEEPAAAGTRALMMIEDLKRLLLHEISSMFNRVASRRVFERMVHLSSIDLDRVTYVEPKDFSTIKSIYANQLNLTQRMLTPFIYNEFGIKLDEGLYESTVVDPQAQTAPVLYTQLLTELRNELRLLFIRHPELRTSDAWQPLLNTSPALTAVVYNHNIFPQPLINMRNLEKEFRDILRPITLSWVREGFDAQLSLSRHLLLNLTDNEMKYLPLWAGGYNDGTGGVFESYLPPAEMGPSGPGPFYHTGITVPSNPSSISESMIEEIRGMRVIGSTTAGSVDVHDSISTVYNPNRVITADDDDTESFTVGGSVYEDARYEIPAAHQATGEALAMVVDTADSESNTHTTDADDDVYFWQEDDDDDEDDDDLTDVEMERS